MTQCPATARYCILSMPYRITETDAPDGYSIDSDWAHYFIWTSSSSEKESAYENAVGDYAGNIVVDSDKINYYYKDASITVDVKNAREQLVVQKLWYDKDNHLVSDSSDTLPESIQVEVRKRRTTDTSDEGEYVTTLTLYRSSGWTASYTIPDPDSGWYYFVRELDTTGKYQVTYTNNNITHGDTILVTNTEKARYELPSTGGAGTTLYTAVGGAIALAALVCGVCQKRRRERRAH